MSTEQYDVPFTAWDAVGPEEVRPDVKVAGGRVSDPRSSLGDSARWQWGPAGSARSLPSSVSACWLWSSGCRSTRSRPTTRVKAPTRRARRRLLEPSSPAETATPKPPREVKMSAAQVRRAIRDRAAQAARTDKTPRLLPKAGPTETPSPSPTDGAADSPGEGGGPPVAPGTAQAIAKTMMKSEGWDPASQFGCLYNLWSRESGWRTTAGRVNGPYGIPQANPGTKMSSAGPNWKTDAATQIKWGFGYIKARYKTPCGGWAEFQSAGWY